MLLFERLHANHEIFKEALEAIFEAILDFRSFKCPSESSEHYFPTISVLFKISDFLKYFCSDDRYINQILRHAREQGNIHFPCSADHEQDWQPYPIDPYSGICDDHTYIHTYVIFFGSRITNSRYQHTCSMYRFRERT